MLLSLLIISWLVFATIATVALFYKNHHDHQVLGVTLSGTHAQSPEVQEIIKGYKWACYLVLLLSAGFSLLLLVKAVGAYGEFYMLVLVLTNLFFNWLAIHRYRQKLLTLKKEKAWTYSRTRVVTVDMNVAKEKGKAGVSPVWTLLFFLLSFVPAVFLFFSAEARAIYPIGFSLIGPFCQLSTVFLYYHMRNRHVPALSENTEINKAYARTEERINTTAATLSSLSMLVFWFLFNFFILYTKSSILIVLPAVILVTKLIVIAYWQQKKSRTAENHFFGTELKDGSDLFEQDSTWKWGCYYNPNDSRIFVPKRIAGMGWTINIAHPVGKGMGLGILILVLVVFISVFYGGAKDYVITENGSQISIDAAMYDLSIEKNQILSVSTIDSLPRGSRTNGYGGANKSFGHFNLDGYGKCMLYVYKQVGQYIVLELEGDSPGYVIVNDKTPEETEELYRDIQQWLATGV